MTDYSEVKWRDYLREKIPNGTRVLLRMEDTHSNISYALGITDVKTGELSYSAREQTETEPTQWMLIPN